MARAYKCERCGELKEGTPKRIKVAEYLSTSTFGWTDKDTKHKVEVCAECRGDLLEQLDEFFSDD
jgi:hypothetical protein